MATNNKGPEAETNWAERSAHWAARAPETISTDDVPNQLLIRLANIQAGDSVLDLASGTGEPSITIAQLVGDEGHVTATDATADMLAAAKKRAERLGLTNIEFQTCPMEELSFEDDLFDAVTCRFGLMHANDAVAGLTQARRVLRPDKRAACLVHAAAENNTAYRVIRATLFDYLGEDDPDYGQRRFRFSQPGELTRLFGSGGFNDIHEEEYSRTVTRDKNDRFWEAQLRQGFGPITKKLSDVEFQELSARMEEAFEPHFVGNQYQLMSTIRGASGVA